MDQQTTENLLQNIIQQEQGVIENVDFKPRSKTLVETTNKQNNDVVSHFGNMSEHV